MIYDRSKSCMQHFPQGTKSDSSFGWDQCSKQSARELIIVVKQYSYAHFPSPLQTPNRRKSISPIHFLPRCTMQRERRLGHPAGVQYHLLPPPPWAGGTTTGPYRSGGLFIRVRTSVNSAGVQALRFLRGEGFLGRFFVLLTCLGPGMARTWRVAWGRLLRLLPRSGADTRGSALDTGTYIMNEMWQGLEGGGIRLTLAL